MRFEKVRKPLWSLVNPSVIHVCLALTITQNFAVFAVRAEATPRKFLTVSTLPTLVTLHAVTAFGADLTFHAVDTVFAVLTILTDRAFFTGFRLLALTALQAKDIVFTMLVFVAVPTIFA